jgi:hypothetical protein
MTAWCKTRHYDPDVTCELRFRHEGMHRAEFAPPVTVELEGMPTPVAQVVSW